MSSRRQLLSLMLSSALLPAHAATTLNSAALQRKLAAAAEDRNPVTHSLDGLGRYRTMATRSRALVSGSGPPSLAARVIDLASFGKILDIVAQRDSLARRRHSKALPMADRDYVLKASRVLTLLRH